MNALVEFIQEQMTREGWKPADLVRASGLAKQVISHLLNSIELKRMIDDTTVEGLARAFCWTAEEEPTPEQYAEAYQQWKRIILLKSAEAIGVPVTEPVVITIPRKPPDAYVVARVREALRLLRKVEDGQPVYIGDPSKVDTAPNTGGADEGVGEQKVSGGTATSGDVRDPQRQSRGSDETNGVEQSEHSNRPQL